MCESFVEAVYTYTRYDTPGQDGETRRDRHARFEQPAPNVVIPEELDYLWGWFWEVTKTGTRVAQNQALPVSHLELKAWADNCDELLHGWEFRLLAQASVAWAAALNDEIRYFQDKEFQKSKVRSKSKK